jgi:ABC-type phosphate transport system substrate-binding protein
MRAIFTTAMLTMLVGCGTTQLSNDMKPYIGRNINELKSHFSYPPGHRETEGGQVYVWSGDTTAHLAISSDDSSRPVTLQYECTLEVTANAQNVILSYQIEGSNAGCAAFRREITH